MKYVIDACNLMFFHHKLEETLERYGFQAARGQLVAMLSRFAHAEGVGDIVAVFDGSEKGAHRPRQVREAAGKVLLIYATSPTNADHAIIEMIEGTQRPGEVTVVSGDKFIIRNVQRAGARHVGCRDFMRQMQRALRRTADPLKGEDPRKFHGMLTERDIAEWAKFMGFKPNEL